MYEGICPKWQMLQMIRDMNGGWRLYNRITQFILSSLFNNIRYFVAVCTKSCIAAPNPDDSPQSRHSQHFLLLQSQTGKELMTEEPARITEAEDENLHYGEIDFSMQRPKTSSDLLRDSGQQEETLYAQVKVSSTATSTTQAADGPEDLYAQVKKKWELLG